MSGNDQAVPKLPPLVPDDAPAAAKLQKPEELRGDKDSLAARVQADADAVIEDTREHVTAASPPKHM
jgi:hypothetical protein